ncbi:hypothetical protein TK50_02815 [Micromonospora haikouensis]|uniref:Uncharacterized protein n=1 Tax=Micromonospora haikouensis TaxID=686309 RepID=A0A0D0V0R2_9ACTN|nr:hypothetical protein TK50_02815 [Micromonospora haikouensis]
MGVSSGVGDVLGALEGGPVDEGFVGVRDVDVAVGDVADVGGVVEDPVDGVSGPLLPGAVGDAAFVEGGGDGAGAGAVAGVEAEDVAEDGGLAGVGDEAVVGVDEVTVGAGAAGPFAFAGFCGHATFHSVDDDVAFEFCEDGEELEHHAAEGSAGVDGFGGG